MAAEFDVTAYLQEHFPRFEPKTVPEKLSGGNLNHVWRIKTEQGSIVLKYAPPHIASAPEIPIDPNRIIVEANALSLFEGSSLSGITNNRIRPPKLLHADRKKYVIILEDVGRLPVLDQMQGADPTLGALLGTFIAQLHINSFGKREISKKIQNLPIQKTRLEVQYAQVSELLQTHGIADAQELGKKAVHLGEKFMSDGSCFIMGDLWPKSILVNEGDNTKIRLIDWEFAHFGRPSQDIAHFLAHLWMLEHRAPSETGRSLIHRFSQKFCTSYFSLIHSAKPVLWNEGEIYNSGVHMGCEILIRCAGTFKGGYLYEDLTPRDKAFQEAVAKAVTFLRKPMNFSKYVNHHEQQD